MSENYWSQENIIGTGAGIASCVKLLNDMIVFGAFDNFVYALNPDDGKISWKFKTNGPVYSTPAIYNNHIYAGSCDGFLYCLDSKGNLVWKFDSGGRIYNTSVICANEKILFGNDNGVFFAINLDGHLLWKFQTGDAIRTTPSIVNDKIIFGSHDHNLYCLNDEGHKEWKFTTGGNMWTCPAVVSKEGENLWSIGNQNPTQSDDYVIYLGCFDGGIYCVDKNGKFIWKYHTNGINSSGPEVANGIVYFGSSDGCLYALDHANRNLKWKYKTAGRIGHSTPLITKENLFVGSFVVDETSASGDMHCININGDFEWKFSASNAIVSTPSIHKDTLFFGSYDGFLYAISVKKHELIWKFRTLHEKISFDQIKSMRHSEIEEERSRNILTTWAPEISTTKQKTDPYESKKIDYNENTVLYGTKEDAGKFSYSPYYKQRKKSAYDN